jgi:cell division protein FtsZ
MIEFELDKKGSQTAIAKIKVIGVGGAGGNTLNSIIESGCAGIEFIAVNTDAQALDLSRADHKIQIGVKSTKGLGTGTNPEIGKRAAEEDIDKVMEVVADADIVFLAAGMGGGTGSGALPVIAHALREKNILTIAIVTKPFQFEGKRRSAVADNALNNVRKEVDTLLVVPNQKLFDVVDQKVSMIDAFSMINDLLTQSVRGISDIITRPGHINVDFADVRTIMKDRGLAVMGTGKASGSDRAEMATLEAISSPLLENMSVEGAHGVLFNITGGKNLGLHEIGKAASIIYEQAHEDANIIIGSVIDESLTDEVIVTIIATGFEKIEKQSLDAGANKDGVKIQATVLDRSEKAVIKHEEPAMVAKEEPKQVAAPVEVIKEVVKAMPVEIKIEEKKVTLHADAFQVETHHVEMHEIDMDDLDVPAFMRQKEQHRED